MFDHFGGPATARVRIGRDTRIDAVVRVGLQVVKQPADWQLTIESIYCFLERPTPAELVEHLTKAIAHHRAVSINLGLWAKQDVGHGLDHVHAIDDADFDVPVATEVLTENAKHFSSWIPTVPRSRCMLLFSFCIQISELPRRTACVGRNDFACLPRPPTSSKWITRLGKAAHLPT